jgi:hypothetical protein
MQGGRSVHFVTQEDVVGGSGGSVVMAGESCKMLPKRWDRAMRSWLLALIVVAAFTGGAFPQEDKKTDDLKPADPDTGESTVEEATLGLLPNPFEKQGVKFAVTYIARG